MRKSRHFREDCVESRSPPRAWCGRHFGNCGNRSRSGCEAYYTPEESCFFRQDVEPPSRQGAKMELGNDVFGVSAVESFWLRLGRLGAFPEDSRSELPVGG